MEFFRNNKVLTVCLIILSFYLYFNFTRIVEGNKKVDKKSEYYINNLYMSDQRIYNNYLSDNEKKMYDLMIKCIQDGITEIEINLADFQCEDPNDCVSLLIVAGDALVVDHPELMKYSSRIIYYDNEIFKIKLPSAIPLSFLEDIGVVRIEKIIDDIKKDTKNMSDKEKIKYVYNWFGNNVNYDKVFTDSSKNQSIYSVFMSKEAVCAGFAKASQIIFQNIGINSYGITGVSSGPHMRNVIEYNGKYYFFDSIVATSLYKTSSSYYDGLKQEKMNSYTIDYPEWYPEIEKVGIF